MTVPHPRDSHDSGAPAIRSGLACSLRQHVTPFWINQGFE